MSLQTAIEFLGQIDQDAKLRATLAALGVAPPIASVLGLAAAAGYRFTAEDLAEAGRTRARSASACGEALSDEALDRVSGGAYEFYVSVKGQTTADPSGGHGGSSSGSGSSGQW